jgi:hypothetical protein
MSTIFCCFFELNSRETIIMAIELVTAGSNDERTNLIGPVLGCLSLKTSSGDDDDVMVCGVFGMGMINHPILEIMSWLT